MAKSKVTPLVNQAPNPITVAEQQISNVQGSLRCCATCIEVLGEKTPTMANFGQLNEALGWLFSLRNQLFGELGETQQKLNDARAKAEELKKGEAKDVPSPTPGN